MILCGVFNCFRVIVMSAFGFRIGAPHPGLLLPMRLPECPPELPTLSHRSTEGHNVTHWLLGFVPAIRLYRLWLTYRLVLGSTMSSVQSATGTQE